MAKAINKILILGNVGDAPEIRAMSTGARVANFSVATNTYAGKDESGNAKERTDWHRVAVWGRLVDVVEQYVHKGDRILIEGEVQYRKDDEGRWWTTVVCRDLTLLGGAKGGNSAPHEEGPPVRTPEKKGPANPNDAEDDLPF